MNICVFCSSSNQIDRCYIAAAQELGRTIAECGHTLIFGGYDMGLMGETAKATVSAGGKVIGVTTAGLSAKGRSVVTGIQELQTENLSKRKETMVSLSDAFITMPGGIGTLDEFSALSRKQKLARFEGKAHCSMSKGILIHWCKCLTTLAKRG